METRNNSGTATMAWSVSALLLAVADALSSRLGAVTVRGEVSGMARAVSGHAYFTLKDTSGAAAALRCVMFKRALGLAALSPADGQQVQARGRLAIYEPRGDLQFIVESLERVGAGSLYEEFLRLRARLEAQGLFDPARKRPLPANPATLGIVTSLGAAALRDVLTTLARRSPQVRVIVYPSLVQGAEAPAALVEAIGQAARRQEVDALLLVRGGGSLEDLWSFNDERVVRAVASSTMPIVCGVGHETDITLCDLAADLRAPTPTAAAELAAPARLLGLHPWVAVAFDTVLEVLDALLQVLPAHLGLGVLVTAVAGVAAVVVVLVAGHALGLVIAVQHEELVVVEGGRLPGRVLVALPAFDLEVAVHGVLGRDVA